MCATFAKTKGSSDNTTKSLILTFYTCKQMQQFENRIFAVAVQ